MVSMCMHNMYVQGLGRALIGRKDRRADFTSNSFRRSFCLFLNLFLFFISIGLRGAGGVSLYE